MLIYNVSYLNFKLEFDGHCYYEKEKVLLRTKETKLLKNCEEITCNDDYSMTLFGFAYKNKVL